MRPHLQEADLKVFRRAEEDTEATNDGRPIAAGHRSCNQFLQTRQIDELRSGYCCEKLEKRSQGDRRRQKQRERERERERN
jgi:hypothetical protein